MKITLPKPKYFFKTIFQGIKKSLKQPKYFGISLGTSVILFGLIVFAQISTQSTASLETYINSLKTMQLAYTLILVTGTGILLGLQAQIYDLNKQLPLKQAAGTALAGLSAIGASVFATLTCASCAAALFGILGANGVFFLADHKFEFILTGSLIILISLFMASERVLGLCETCQIHSTQTH